MGLKNLFIKNKAEETETEEQVSKPKKKSRKVKKNDLLSSVISESVTEHALSVMRDNKFFTTERKGVKVHVCMALDCAEVGGISKSAARENADKGSIIECIANDRIKVFATKLLLDANILVIIPDVDTLENVDEFSLLTKAPYKLMFVEDDARQVDMTPEVAVTFEDIQAVSRDDQSIDELLASKGVTWAKGYVAPVEDISTDETILLDEPVTQESDETVLLDEPVMQDIDEPEPVEEQTGVISDEPVVDAADFMTEDIVLDEEEPQLPQDDIALSEDAYNAQEVQQQAQESTFEPESEPEPEIQPEPQGVDVSAAEMREACARTFFNQELGLEVPMDAFEQKFMQTNNVILFEDNRPDDVWLNNYLNQLSAEANADLMRMHESHLFLIRDLYQRLTSSCIAQIQEMLDKKNIATQYGQRVAKVEDDYKQQYDQIDTLIQDRAHVLKSEFESKVKAAGAAAAQQAEKTYRDQHGEEHSAKIGRISTDIKCELKGELTDQLAAIDDDRRAEAHARMDLGVTNILNRLGKEYQKLLSIENDRYEEHRREIAAYVEENRANDIAWARSIEGELEREDKIHALQDDFKLRQEMAQADFDQRAQALKDEIAQMEDRNRRALETKDSEWKSTVDALKSEKEMLQNKVDELNDRFSVLDDEKERRYALRIKSLQSDIDAANERYDKLLTHEHKAQYLWIAVAVVAIIAAGCVGMILGVNQRMGYDLSSVKSFMSPIVSYLTPLLP